MDLIDVSIDAAPSWHILSLCADSDQFNPDIWFDDADVARRICAHCPVRNDCLTYAMDVEAATGAQLIGVWGGLSPIQRKRLRQHPDRLDRMRRVRSRTRLRILPAVTRKTAAPAAERQVQLVLVLD